MSEGSDSTTEAASPCCCLKAPSRRLPKMALTVAPVLLLGGFVTGCISAGAQTPACVPRAEILPASQASSLILVVPRTSTGAARWGLGEAAHLLPFVAYAGLDLHVFYTEDADDLGEDGGDGGPPQVLQTQAPNFAAFSVPGVPQPPADSNALTAKLYCERLAVWEGHASQALRAEASRRAAAVRAWARTVAARLAALADKPIPDTTGAEAGVEFDAAASVFAAVQVVNAVPRATVVFLGGLTALAPPRGDFRLPAHFVAVVRSTNPSQVLPAERAWSRWVTQNGGVFTAISANDAPAVITRALVGWWK